ncbi:hypothetical protein BMS3Abin01_00717 [bacterium BMS3Abin01]|nr:hypothetical protein BMS3Abin01_00717 [bacterium BMS3Abin01]
MRILAIDVGMGTADILAYDSSLEIKNCPKLVVPSCTQVVARRIQQATADGRTVVFDGVTMGGGPCGRALKKHLEAGLGFIASPAAARTFNDDLELVDSWGVCIEQEPHSAAPAGSIHLTSGDLDLSGLLDIFQRLGISGDFDGFAVAVQDHGFSPGASNRRHRFQLWRRSLAGGADLERFAYPASRIPGDYTRMRAVASLLAGQPGVMLMDTGPAALWGALPEMDAEGGPEEARELVANLGNGHTLAAIMAGNRIDALVEHHTGLLESGSFGPFIRRFAAGDLSDDQVFSDGGHGCIPPDTGMELAAPVIVTGPRRRLARGSGLKLRFAAPHGDMMLTGCFGLVEAWKSIISDLSF